MAVTSQQIIDFLLANPGMSDAQIVAAMEQYGVSPAQMATAVGLDEGAVASRAAATVPQGQTITLGDTIVQPVYQTTGSGMDQQIGGLENVITYKATDNRAGGSYTQYTPTGEVEQTGTQQEVKSGLKEFAIGAAVLFGLPYLLNAGAATGTATTFAGEALADAGLLSGGGSLTAGLTVADIAALEAGLPTGLGSLTTGLTAAQIAAGEAALPALTATELAALSSGGLLSTGGGSLTAGLTPAQIAAAETGLTTGATTAATATTIPAATATIPAATATIPAATTAATVATTAAATGLTTTQVADLVKTGLTTAQIANLFSTGATTAAGLLQQQTSKEAAIKAQGMIDTETAAAKQAAQFRPIGMTTRFGASQFGFDPKTGQLTSAGYTLSPEAKNAQDRFVKLAERGLQQAESAQEQFKPALRGAESLATLGQGYLDAQTDPRLAQIASQYLPQSAESKMLTSLGSQYIAQSPEAVAQNYLNQQMALLQPGRELELANLQNRLQQQGRGGLSVAQGGTYGATTPELQALYNARAMQEAQLAANAQQAGQQQVQFGAGLVGTGQQLGMQGQQFGMDTLARQQALEQQRIGFGSGLFNQAAGLMGQYYAGQQAAYAPYTTALGQVQGLETAAQQPLQMGANLGQTAAQAGFNVGQLGLRGAGASVELATGKAATNNPYASAISGLAANPAFAQYAGGLLSNTPTTSGFSYGKYGTGVDPSTGEYFGSLYF